LLTLKIYLYKLIINLKTYLYIYLIVQERKNFLLHPWSQSYQNIKINPYLHEDRNPGEIRIESRVQVQAKDWHPQTYPPPRKEETYWGTTICSGPIKGQTRRRKKNRRQRETREKKNKGKTEQRRRKQRHTGRATNRQPKKKKQDKGREESARSASNLKLSITIIFVFKRQLQVRLPFCPVSAFLNC
jgi:hypothetical protein